MKEVVVTLAGRPIKLPRTVREVTRKRRRNDAALRFKTPRPVARYCALLICFSTMNTVHKPLMSHVKCLVFLLCRAERKRMEKVKKEMRPERPKIARRSARSLKMTICGQRPGMR